MTDMRSPLRPIAIVAALLISVLPIAASADEVAQGGDESDAGSTGTASAPMNDDSGSYRSGFTLELSLGFGIQFVVPSEGESDTDLGLGGLNLGIGGFLNNDMAVLFRFIGTTTFFDLADGASARRTSGVAGPAFQYWPLDYLKLEAGIGLAVVTTEVDINTGFGTFIASDDEVGFGVMAVVAAPFWHSEDHSLEFALEYAPGFFEDGSIHNLIVAFGWQYL